MPNLANGLKSAPSFKSELQNWPQNMNHDPEFTHYFISTLVSKHQIYTNYFLFTFFVSNYLLTCTRNTLKKIDSRWHWTYIQPPKTETSRRDSTKNCSYHLLVSLLKSRGSLNPLQHLAHKILSLSKSSEILMELTCRTWEIIKPSRLTQCFLPTWNLWYCIVQRFKTKADLVLSRS